MSVVESETMFPALKTFIQKENSLLKDSDGLYFKRTKFFDLKVEKTNSDIAIAQLHQLGILNFDAYESGQLQLFQNSNSFIRDIKLLDKINR